MRKIAIWAAKGFLAAAAVVVVLLAVLLKTSIGHRTIAWFVGSSRYASR